MYFFQWISGYLDAWLPMHMILVAPRKCLIFERMIRCLAIILTSVTLPFATLPLLPYTCNLTVVGPMKCLIFELMNGWSDVLVLPRHPLSYQTQPYLAFFKIGSVYFFQWIMHNLKLQFSIFGSCVYVSVDIWILDFRYSLIWYPSILSLGDHNCMDARGFKAPTNS